MNVVDSSAWIEFFESGPNSAEFRAAILDLNRLIVPSIVLLEVFKRVLRERGEDFAQEAAAAIHQGRVVPLDEELALSAARLGVIHRLPLADSVVYATAQRYQATVWTQDADFKGLPSVEFRAKARN